MRLFTFSEVITDATSKFRKIKVSEYKTEGRFKIIDQGQKEIAGYTDDESLINKTHTPIIIFGDHTRALKYEESPIALGADGAKALSVNPTLANALYVYYYLRTINLKAAGYSRHFKFLRQVEIPIPEKDGEPDFDDQKRIAHLLGKVEGLIARRKQHLQQLDDLLKSVFLEMFGDPVRNEKNHNISTLAPYITHLTSGGRGWARYYSDTGKRFIRSLDVQMNAIGSDDVVYVTPPNNKETERTRVIPGDVLLTITGSKIGRVCSVPQDFEEAYISQHVAIVRTKGINTVYLSFYLSMPACGQRTIAKQQYGQAKPGLNLTQIQNFEIIDPDIDLQNHFAAIVEKVDTLKSRYQQSLTDLESLYGALSQKAFKGALDLSRVVLPVESTTEDTESTEEMNRETREERESKAGVAV